MQVVFTSRAERDLSFIYEYFLETAPHKADEILDELIARTHQLEQHPYSGPEELFLKTWGFDYRFLTEGNYKIIYSIRGETVYIIQIFDSRQNPTSLLR